MMIWITIIFNYNKIIGLVWQGTNVATTEKQKDCMTVHSTLPNDNLILII